MFFLSLWLPQYFSELDFLQASFSFFNGLFNPIIYKMLFSIFYGNLNSSRPNSNTCRAFEDQLLILCSLSQLKFTDCFSEQSVMWWSALFHNAVRGQCFLRLSSGVLTSILTIAQLFYVSFDVTKGKTWL